MRNFEKPVVVHSWSLGQHPMALSRQLFRETVPLTVKQKNSIIKQSLRMSEHCIFQLITFLESLTASTGK
jgi:hypothetical protein